MSDQQENAPEADLRTSLRAPLIIRKIPIKDERTVFFGYTKNISRSGMFIATTNPIEPGEQINLEIPLPNRHNNEVRCCCEIVWKRPFGKHLPFEPGMGMKFLDLPDDIADELDQWIKELSVNQNQ